MWGLYNILVSVLKRTITQLKKQDPDLGIGQENVYIHVGEYILYRQYEVPKRRKVKDNNSLKRLHGFKEGLKGQTAGERLVVSGAGSNECKGRGENKDDGKTGGYVR